MKTKVALLVLNNFINDSRVLKEALSLSKAGYKVTVLAMHEDNLPEHEQADGIDVQRVKLRSRGWSKHKLVQFLKYIEMMIRVFSLTRRTDIIHCNDLNSLPMGVFVKLMRGGRPRILYDAHEYEINQIPFQSKRSVKLHYHLERALIRFADKVITVSNSIALEYQRLYSIETPALVLNCPPLSAPQGNDIFRETFDLTQEQKLFLYQGGLTKGRGLDLLLEFFQKRESQDIVLIVMGYGLLQSEVEKYADNSPNIYFHKAVAPDILLNYTSSADFGIAFIEASCLSLTYCLPNKLFEYLMAGIPVLSSNLPEMRDFLKKHEVGVVAQTNDLRGLEAAISKLCALDGNTLATNIAGVRQKYCWENQEQALLGVYKEIS